MLHIFRNSPLGRENLMQSAYFCKKHFGLALQVYIPSTPQFTIDIGASQFMIELDDSYTLYPHSARQRVADTLEKADCAYSLIGPPGGEAGAAPYLPGAWTIMACPRVISEHSGRIGLGHIGPKVRSLVKSATFPVFIPSMAYKVWTSVTAFFGGSALGALAVKEALAIARLSRVPATIHTQLDGITREECEKALEEAEILGAVSGSDVTWRVYDGGDLVENLYNVAHDSLVVVGAAGHNVIQELVFGSKLEAIQSTLPNPLVVVGPNCITPWDEAAGS
jgi:nucleotide-binding universal stress UspA family protein